MSAHKLPDPGELRRRVTFQQRTAGQDAAGGILAGWADAFGAFAKVDPLTGRELLAAQAVHAEITVEVYVRWRPELADPRTAARYRILYGTRRLNILSVIDIDDRRHFVVLQCSEGLFDQESQP